MTRLSRRSLGAVADGAPPPVHSGTLRRLFAEAHTMSLYEIRQKVEGMDNDPPRRIPQAERESRRAALATLGWRRDSSCSATSSRRTMWSIDSPRCSKMTASSTSRGTLRRPGRLSSKLGPTKKRWVPNADGIVREVASKDAPTCDVSSHWSISLALQRRAFGRGYWRRDDI